MSRYFIGTTTNNDTGWTQMHSGNSQADNQDYYVATNYCDSFLYLQRPPAQLLTIYDLNVLYLVQHKEQQLRLRLVELIQIPFKYVGDMITYAAVGMDGVSWRRQWLEKYLETKEETEIGVYIYKRVE